MLANYYGRLKQDRAYRSLYSRFISPGNLVFDVGANHGNRTRIFLRLGANVVAFEPQTACYNDLRDKFGGKKGFTAEKIALDRRETELVMKISDSDTISSMSPEFINRVTESGRFSNYAWNSEELVRTTTLDSMLVKHGVPKFIKIDVEGYELNVIAGLHYPVDIVSFEFVPEILEPAIGSIEHLSSLADYRFNYSFGESMKFQSDRNIYASEMITKLETLPDKTVFGDIYAIKSMEEVV